MAGSVGGNIMSKQGTVGATDCQPHDVPVITAARLLKPLGNPQPNSVKFYSAAEVLELSKDRTWLAKVTNAINQHWQKKNAAKRNGSAIRLQAAAGEME